MSDGQLPDRGAVPVDHVSLRRHNLAVVLGNLRESGPRSRARIATDTGLNKATVSSLVSELSDLGLVRDGEVERGGGVGRPGQTVEVDGRVCGLGVEANVDYIAVLVLDLRGEEVLYRRTPVDVPGLGAQRTLDELARAIRSAVAELRDGGRDVAGVTVALPGMVETTPGVLRHAPNIGWQQVQVADELTARLAAADGDDGTARVACPIRVDNDANLSALAEYVMGSSAGVADLVHLTGETGVGGGVIADGQLLRGTQGFGGEIGHMPIGNPSQPCGCGRFGCWETAVGLAALLREVADPDDTTITDPSVDLDIRLAEIRRRAELGDGRTLRGLEAIGTALGLGAAILVDLLNPRVIALGGYFAVLGDFFLHAMETELDKRVVLPGRGGCRIVLSSLGFRAACRGGAHVALEAVLTDPASVATPTAVVAEVPGGMA
ncbi:putative NBD/HSP70 family sugar kinase [Haloactinopolyspora alba]|uniref:Putative NBD/HSP70 family sugar kinase n=1 Tax=Haloactinopolyspora alba TaxID=648780 RepID=A0A2P8EBY5_9ACTN|nr:ROK family transcriptional regulator [Haloactinopolyspora alba]PSL06988.1 putative NBD/HSP70 family sugar kinase [Haloactinopolyspora alba]